MNSEAEIGPKSQPLEVFSQWMTEAQSHSAVREPTAMTLSTASSAGDIHSRIVLCKQWSIAGFQFYTNYNSRKGRDLAQNPKAALLFYWDPFMRQVHISGFVEKVPRGESQEYWRSRPRESQVSQYISRQSDEVGSRQELESLWQACEQKFAGQEIPCPEHWGGYLVRPTGMEFWIGRPGRLHDRFHFEKAGSSWTFRRLCP
jgi:pyridoxamine-phosphate oxidase